MDWQYVFTSFEGRINRGKFWAAVAVFVAIGIVDLIPGTSPRIGDIDFGIVGMIVSLATIYFAFAVYAKRWHDRNRSGWSLAPIAVLLIAAIPMSLLPSAVLVIGLIQLAVLVWVLVELGILKGTAGPNVCGPDPLGA